MIVDLLTEKVDISNICGILVANAHKITETSMESFILRVYRQKNRTGFIKVNFLPLLFLVANIDTSIIYVLTLRYIM